MIRQRNITCIYIEIWQRNKQNYDNTSMRKKDTHTSKNSSQNAFQIKMKIMNIQTKKYINEIV